LAEITSKKVVCSFCLGKKKIEGGEFGTDSKGFPYSTRKKYKCWVCDGKGKGDFSITSEQALDAMSNFTWDGVSAWKTGK
jgi:hypothetical protein